MQIIKEKYYADYIGKDNLKIFNKTTKYGLNFKDRFGLTPLMIAIKVGNAEIAEKLIAQGADTEYYDNNGLTPIQNFLSNLFYLGQYSRESSLVRLYEILGQNSLLIKAKEKLHKIDNNRMEYFLYHYMVGVFVNYTLQDLQNDKMFPIGFTAVDLAHYLRKIPDRILAPYQKRRQYISSILSKNERSSNNPYCKLLFMRIRVGHYIINPSLEIKFNGEWKRLYDLIEFDLNDTNNANSINDNPTAHEHHDNKSKLRTVIKFIENSNLR